MRGGVAAAHPSIHPPVVAHDVLRLEQQQIATTAAAG
jgi:hypothetical protein